MREGNWIPISKALVKALPLDRPYTELEAMFSLTVNHDNGQLSSVSGLSKLWGWSRKRVTAFIDRIGVDLIYPEATSTRTPKEQVALQVRGMSGASKGQVKFIDSRCLSGDRDKLGTSKRQVRGKLGSTYNDPDPNPDPEGSCAELFQASAPPASPVLSIILNTKALYPITQADIDSWQGYFPAVDVLQALRNMAAWAEANPWKRKTISGVRSFIVKWLTKEQNRGSTPHTFQPASPPSPQPLSLTPEQGERRRQIAEMERQHALA